MGGIITSATLGEHSRPITYRAYVLEVAEEESEQCQPILEAPKTKRERKQSKQLLKFQQTMRKCSKYLFNGNHQSAIPLLQVLIAEGEFLEEYEFKGEGNEECWNGYYKEGALSWVKHKREQGEEILNPFDLMSLCIFYQTNQKVANWQQYAEWYETALQESERYELYFGLGNLYYNTGCYLKAEENYKRVIELNDHFAKGYQYLAWIYGYWFDHDSLASQYAGRSLELNPSSLTCRYIKAVSEQSSEKRMAKLQQLIDEDPQYYRIYVNLGQLQTEEDSSKLYYNKCLAYDPLYKFVYLKLGDLERFKENFHEAQQYYMKVKEIDEVEEYTYFYLGCLAEDQGNYEEALVLYQLCLQLNPYNTDICAIISNYYKTMGDIEKAITYMLKQLEQNPYDYQNANLLGILYDEEDETDKALKYFHLSVAINSQYYQPYVNLGSTYHEKKEYAQAIKHYLKANSLRSWEIDPYFGLALSEAYSDNSDSAISWCLECIKRGGDQDKQVFQLLGDIYQKKKEYQNSFHTYLTYSIESKALHTEYILNNLMLVLERNEAMAIIERELATENQSEFFYAEIGKILLAFQEQRWSSFCFQKLQTLCDRAKLHPIVDQQMKRYNGTSEYIRNNYHLGVRAYQYKIRLLALKGEFQAKFEALYCVSD